MRIHHFLLYSSLTLACAADSEDDVECVSRVFEVSMTKDAPIGWRVATERAIDEWNVILDGHARLRFSTVDGQSLTERNCAVPITVVPGLGMSHGRTRWRLDEDGYAAGATIWFSAETVRDDIRYTTALHELGHALGMQHERDSNHDSVMWPFVTVPGRISCWDRISLCRIWGCDPKCEVNP